MTTRSAITISDSILAHLNGGGVIDSSTASELLSAGAEIVSQMPPILDNGVSTMYALAFDLDTASLQQTYHVSSYSNAYNEIRSKLGTYGFDWQQDSVYYGNKETVNAVTCVLAVIDLTNSYSWFAASVRDIRMLRIEEQNDLLPAIQQAVAAQQNVANSKGSSK